MINVNRIDLPKWSAKCFDRSRWTHERISCARVLLTVFRSSGTTRHNYKIIIVQWSTWYYQLLKILNQIVIRWKLWLWHLLGTFGCFYNNCVELVIRSWHKLFAEDFSGVIRVGRSLSGNVSGSANWTRFGGDSVASTENITRFVIAFYLLDAYYHIGPINECTHEYLT